MILRELFAKLGLDVDAQSFAKGALAIEGVKLLVGKLVDKAEELVHQFVENVQATAEFAEEIDGLAQSTGLGTDSLQKLGKAAASEGIGIEEFARSMILLDRTMVAAKNGNEEAGKAFKKAGVEYKDAAGQLRPTEDIFLDMADGFSAMEDGAEKTALAMQLFGRSGAGMIQVLNNGREELESYMAAQVMTPEQIEAGKEMIMVQRKLEAQTKSLWRGAIAPLLPAITDLLQQYLAWKKANAEVLKQRIQSVLGAVIRVVRGLAVAFKFLVGVLGFFADNWKVIVALIAGGVGAWLLLNTALIASFVATSAAAVASAAVAGAAWLAAAAPFVALAALIAGILLVFEDIKVYQQGGRSLYGRFKKEIDEWLRPKATDPWWLSALKELVTYMQKALGLASELGLAGGRPKPGARPTQAQALVAGGVVDPNTGAPTGISSRKGNPTFSPDQEARYFQIQREQGEFAAIKDRIKSIFGFSVPELPQASSGFGAAVPAGAPANYGRGYGVFAPSQTNQISVVAAPGQSVEDISDEIDRRITASWQTNLEAAAAAGGD